MLLHCINAGVIIAQATATSFCGFLHDVVAQDLDVRRTEKLFRCRMWPEAQKTFDKIMLVVISRLSRFPQSSLSLKDVFGEADPSLYGLNSQAPSFQDC